MVQQPHIAHATQGWAQPFYFSYKPMQTILRFSRKMQTIRLDGEPIYRNQASNVSVVLAWQSHTSPIQVSMCRSGICRLLKKPHHLFILHAQSLWHNAHGSCNKHTWLPNNAACPLYSVWSSFFMPCTAVAVPGIISCIVNWVLCSQMYEFIRFRCLISTCCMMYLQKSV